MEAAKFLTRHTIRVKQLTKEDELYIIRLAQLGKIQDAISNYLFFALGELETDPLGDPRFVSVSNDACWFVFIHSTPEYTPDARPWMKDFLTGREAINIPLLNTAFKKYQEECAYSNRSLLPRLPLADSTPAPEQINLDNLSDEEINDLRNRTLRAYAKERR